MPTKKKKRSSTRTTPRGRTLTVTMEPVAGALTLFYAFVDGRRVIAGDGTARRSWTGTISDAQVRLTIRVVGIGSARFKLGIDLPGTADDQSLEFTLTRGYYEASFTL